MPYFVEIYCVECKEPWIVKPDTVALYKYVSGNEPAWIVYFSCTECGPVCRKPSLGTVSYLFKAGIQPITLEPHPETVGDYPALMDETSPPFTNEDQLDFHELLFDEGLFCGERACRSKEQFCHGLRGWADL